MKLQSASDYFQINLCDRKIPGDTHKQAEIFWGETESGEKSVKLHFCEKISMTNEPIFNSCDLQGTEEKIVFH